MSIEISPETEARLTEEAQRAGLSVDALLSRLFNEHSMGTEGRKRIFELEEENEALKKKLNFARGVPAEDLVAELTDGVRTGYKDRHDVTTKRGHRLEVKMSHLNRPGSSRTRRWNWDKLLGLNETKEYDFLVLVGEKDQRYAAQYPPNLPYVCFVVPRGEVYTIKSSGNCVALNTNLITARAPKAKVLIRYLVRSAEDFKEL